MKWITIEGREQDLLIHGAYDLQVGDRVTVFPAKGEKVPAAASKGLAITAGARVVVVPHERYPGSRISRSVFQNDAVGPQVMIGDLGTQTIYVMQEADWDDTTTSNPPIISRLWNFGDPSSGALNTSTEEKPQHQYDHPGWYDVSLTACNSLVCDTLKQDGAVHVLVPGPTSLSACANDGGEGGISLSWTPGDPNDTCKILRRDDFSPPNPYNGTVVYSGAAVAVIDQPPNIDGQRYYYRVWGVYEGVFSEGYRSASAELFGIAGSGIDWGLFTPTISTGDGVSGGGLISSDVHPDDREGGVGMELYFLKEGSGGASWARATGTISGEYRRITGWVGMNISTIPGAGGVRIKVNGTTIYNKTEVSFNMAWGSIVGIQIDAYLSGGNNISNFELQFERYHNQSYRTRFSAYFYDVRLE